MHVHQAPDPPRSPLVEMLSPLYYGTKLLCLSPYKKTRNHFEKSTFGFVVTLCAALFFFLNSMRVITYFFFESNNIIVQITLRLRIYISFTSTLLIYVNEMKGQKKFIYILECFKEIDSALLKMGVDIPYGRSKQRIVALVFCLYAFSVTTTIFDYWAYWRSPITSYRLQFTLLFVIPNIVHSAVACVFCTYIWLIKQRFAIINDQILQGILNVQKNFFKNDYYNGLRRASKRNVFEQTLMETKKIHYKLCLLMQVVNSIYSIPMLFTLGIAYCGIFTQMFYWYTDFRHVGLKNFTTLATLHTSIVEVLLILWIVGLTVTCDECISEAKKSAPILFRINCYSDLTNVIRLFAFQLLELPRNISAAGFFDVNKQLLSTIFGSTATFLVILIQFDLAA